jgi:dTDP-4-dehydrorhamnose 3,5-epimerase-like enzyme
VIFTETPLAGAYVIDLERRGDARGFFARTFCAREFAEHGLATDLRAGQHEPVGHTRHAAGPALSSIPPPKRRS